MNVLQLCLSAGLGGLELYVYRAAMALGKDHSVSAVLRQDSKLDAYFREHADFHIEYLQRRANPLPLRNARKLARLIDARDIDVIHMHWGKDLPLAAFAKAFSRRKPALVYTRQMMITRKKDDFYHHFLYRQLDRMLTITRELETLCKRFIPRHADKISTLYYGVDAPEYLLGRAERQALRQQRTWHEKDFIAGLIGRLEESKGQHLLIDAIRIASEKNMNLQALIVGHEMTPGYRERLQQQARRAGIESRIHFEDFVARPQQLMQLCDCIVLASRQETFGLVLPEAMRSGVAVIGSNRGGVPEIIRHDETGLLFESGDAASLFGQLERYCKDPGLRQRLAENGRQDADARFDTARHFATLERHLIDACQNVSQKARPNP